MISQVMIHHLPVLRKLHFAKPKSSISSCLMKLKAVALKKAEEKVMVGDYKVKKWELHFKYFITYKK